MKSHYQSIIRIKNVGQVKEQVNRTLRGGKHDEHIVVTGDQGDLYWSWEVKLPSSRGVNVIP